MKPKKCNLHNAHHETKYQTLFLYPVM